MTSLLGWLGSATDANGLLHKMAAACDLPQPPLQTSSDADFTVAAADTLGGSHQERLATSADGQITVAFAGHLHDEDPARKQHPAAWCLQLYRQHGPDFPIHLNGTFALAIYDRNTPALHLVSDRMATRGLYYHTALPFVFGTEVKFLLEHPEVSRRVNPDRLREFLLVEYLPGTATYYDHIRQVPPATVLTWQQGQLSSHRYWVPRFDGAEDRPLADHARQMADALRHATRRVCAGHERIGLMLSGGLDSRAVACAAAVPVTCMTIHAHRGMEVDVAVRVAATLGQPHEFIATSDTYPLELVTVGSLIADGMHSFHHAQSLLVRPLVEGQGLSLLLNGACLDNLFGGSALVAAKRRGLAALLPPVLADAAAVDPVVRLAKFQTASDACLDAILLGTSAADVKRQTRQTVTAVLSEIAPYARSNHDMISWLSLHNISKHRSMLNVSAFARFVDEGVPYYDNEMIATALALPPQYLFQARAYAHAIHLLNPRVTRIPRSGTGLPVPLSPTGEIVHHYRSWCSTRFARLRTRLHGYRRHDTSPWPRMDLAMQRSAQWHEFLRRRLDESVLIDMGLLHGDNMRRVVEDQIGGRRHTAVLICAWLTLEEWLRRYG